MARETLEAKYYNYPWHTIDKKKDVVGFDYTGCYIYIMKGFRESTNNYTRIKVSLPKEIGQTIWMDAYSHCRSGD